MLHVCHGFYPEGAGGVESYLRDVIRAQRAAGIDARLLTGSQVPWPDVGVEELELEGIPSYRLHRDDLFFDHFAKLWHPVVGAQFVALLERFGPDVVHLHQWIRLTCELVELAEDAGYPTVVTLHDLYTSCPRCFRVRPDDEHCERELSVASCAGCVPRYGHESEREVRASIELYRDQYAAEVARARVVLVASEATRDLIAATTPIAVERFALLPLAYPPRFAGLPRAAPPNAGEPFRFAYWGT
ncbi:MAG: glycosyltransferase [Planctomycetes bacterium]|nr:glycosyltransferase [Planctomycetota bacterium]